MLNELSTNGLINLLFEQENDFLGVYDMQQDCYIRINQAGVRLLGYPSEQHLLDQPAPAVSSQPLSGNDRTTTIARLVQESLHEEETEVMRYDGKVFWGRVTISLFPAGQMALVRITNLDRLHRTERALEYSVKRYEAIFSNATIGIIVCNKQGSIVSANQLAHQLFGYTDGELITVTIEELVPKGVSYYHEKLRQSFNDNPQVRAMGHNRDLHAQRKDGSVFPVEISLSYFWLEAELYVVAYIIDITLKKVAEQQLLSHRDDIEKLNAELEQKVADRTHALLNTLDQLEQSKDELARALTTERELGELKSRFVSMASHEFRTPLTAVLNATTLIEKYPADNQQDKRQKHLHRIRESVKQLNDILEEFLSVGKLEEGKISAHPVQIDIARLVTDTIADMQPLVKMGQVIQCDVACSAPIWLDPSLLRKILVNLLSNAIKYSRPGTIVQVKASCVSSQFTLIVADQGIGIAADDKQHLFEHFFRAKNAINMPGTGLGLHIVAKYVELMQGTITLESELNQGTTITLTLPYENHPLD